MLTDRHFPYSSMQEINLDWILTKVKNILRFVPDDGAVGQILRRTAHGAEWSDEQGGGGAVSSVNGQTGAVVLTASDVGALPDTYAAPVDSVNGQTGAVVLDAGDVGALPDTTVIPSDTSDLTNTAGFVDAAGAAAAAPVQSVNSQTGAVVLGKSDVGLGSVDNVQQYSASNPPPYPVTSVNGQTGAVVVTTPPDFFNKTLTSRCWGKAISVSSIDFVLYLPYIEDQYNIAFANNRVNIADIGNSSISTIHSKDMLCVYFRASVTNATVNRMYIAEAIFTLTKV